MFWDGGIGEEEGEFLGWCQESRIMRMLVRLVRKRFLIDAPDAEDHEE